MRFAAHDTRALAGVTLERANADLILGELERFAELMRTSAAASAALTNPVINRTQRALAAVLAWLGLSPEAANFLRLLCRNGRLGALLDESLERAIGKVVRPQWKLDPSIVGGASVKLGGRIIDSSIRAQLVEIRRWMVQAPLPPSMLFSRPARRSGEGRKKYDEA